jgi:hypothetical protein
MCGQEHGQGRTRYNTLEIPLNGIILAVLRLAKDKSSGMI